VVTIEPGIYFVPALLTDSDLRRRHHDGVAWDQVERLLDFGGIRLEENVLITDHGTEVLTADIPLL
jgi:Xaa-Pro aminopeptidase